MWIWVEETSWKEISYGWKHETEGRAGTAAGLGYVAIIAAIVSPQGVFLFLVDASGAVMLFVYLSTALAEIVGVLIAMGTDAGLRPQLMASIASLAVASAAGLLAVRRRHADEGTRTRYLASIERHAMQGDRSWRT